MKITKEKLRRAGITDQMIDDYARDYCLDAQTARERLYRNEQRFRAKETDLFAGCPELEINPFISGDKQGKMF